MAHVGSESAFSGSGCRKGMDATCPTTVFKAHRSLKPRLESNKEEERSPFSGSGCRKGIDATCPEREFFIDNLLVRIHFIIVVIRWTGLAPWEFELPFPGSLTSTFLAPPAEPPARRVGLKHPLNFFGLYRSSLESGDLQCKPGVSKTTTCSHSGDCGVVDALCR